MRLAPAAMLSLAVLVACLALAAPASADAGCDRFAAPGGDIWSGGTDPAAPAGNPMFALTVAAPGEEVCVEDNASFDIAGCNGVVNTAGTAAAPKVLRPETPGARATIRMGCGFKFAVESRYIEVRDLDFRKDDAEPGSVMQIDGDDLEFDGIDVTSEQRICLDIGEDSRAGQTGRAERVVVRNSRIHHCGSEYGPPHFEKDSGVHGIYVEMTQDAIIEDNLVYANNNRGIQLYPDADATVVRRNVMYGNGGNLNLGSSYQDAVKVYSQHNRVTKNILLDSRMDQGYNQELAEVLGYFDAVTDHDNVVTDNCITNTAGKPLYDGPGYTHAGNDENVAPGFADPAAGDFSLPAGSPCLGRGPAWIQPSVPKCHGRVATDTAPPYAATVGDDVWIGTGADEVLDAGAGDDAICSGGGFDTLSGGPGDDVLDGEAGGDGVEYIGSAAGVTVDLAPGTGRGEGADTLVSISEAYGSTHADTLLGRADADTLFGAAGPDIIEGRGGPDFLTGFTGADTIRARDGVADQISCGEGHDAVAADGADTRTIDCEEGPAADFNDDGYTDVAVGVPGEDLSGLADAGAVQVLYGGPGGLSIAGQQLWTQNSGGITDAVEAGDGFGAAVAAGDVNGDGFDDLAVGAPGEDLAGGADGGVVHVLLGGANGLRSSGSQYRTQATGGAGVVEPGDGFGAVLAAGRVDADDFADVVVGVPSEDVSAAVDAGVVHVLRGGAGGVSSTGQAVWSQNTAGVGDAAEGGDEFGAAVAIGSLDGGRGGELVVGAPGELLGASDDAGLVHVIPGGDGGATAQTVSDAFGGGAAVEAGDRFGRVIAVGHYDNDGFTDVAIGAPREDVGDAADAGSVRILRGGGSGLTTTGQRVWTQNASGIADAAEAGDGFGSALAAGDVDGDARGDLLIGALGEGLPGAAGAGVVHVLRGAFGRPGGLTSAGSQLWSQSSTGIGDTPEAGDRFGTALVVGKLDADEFGDALIGAPGEDLAAADAGLAHVIRGAATGLVSTGQKLWSQDSSGVLDTAEAGDGFASALGR